MEIICLGCMHGLEAIFNFVEEAEAGHISILFKGVPVKLRQQWSDTSCPGVITLGTPGCRGSHTAEAYSRLGPV